MRRILAIIGAVALAAALSFPASAGQAVPLDLANVQGGGQATNVIEKQTWWLDCCTPDPDHTVTNPGGLGSWDINDHNDYVAGGYVAAGETTTGTYRHVFDWGPMFSCRPVCADWSGRSNWYGTSVQAPSAALDVVVCFEPQGRCFTLAPNPVGRAWSYEFCGHAVYAPDDPAIVDIPGSGGGRGVPTTISLTVSNPTSRTVKNVSGGFGISSDVTFPTGCHPDPNDGGGQYDYPFGWH